MDRQEIPLAAATSPKDALQKKLQGFPNFLASIISAVSQREREYIDEAYWRSGLTKEGLNRHQQELARFASADCLDLMTAVMWRLQAIVDEIHHLIEKEVTGVSKYFPILDAVAALEKKVNEFDAPGRMYDHIDRMLEAIKLVSRHTDEVHSAVLSFLATTT